MYWKSKWYFLTIWHFQSWVQGQNFLIQTDNAMTTHYINHVCGTRSLQLCHIAWELLLRYLQYKITIQANHEEHYLGFYRCQRVFCSSRSIYPGLNSVMHTGGEPFCLFPQPQTTKMVHLVLIVIGSSMEWLLPEVIKFPVCLSSTSDPLQSLSKDCVPWGDSNPHHFF